MERYTSLGLRQHNKMDLLWLCAEAILETTCLIFHALLDIYRLFSLYHIYSYEM